MYFIYFTIFFCALFSGLASSLTAGVFLATCYIQAMPLVEVKFIEICKDMDTIDALAIAQCCVLVGFVCIMCIEQAVEYYQPNQPDSELPIFNESCQAVDIPHGYLPSSDESEESIPEEEESKKAMLPRKKRKSSKTGTISNNNSYSTPKSKIGRGKAKLSRSSKTHNISTSAVNSPKSPKKCGHSGGHGHSHMVDILQEHSGLRCVLLILALSTHTLFEGVAVGLQTDAQNLINFFLGVLVHECFIAFAVGVSLAKQTIKRRISVLLGVMFSLTVPVGMVIGMAIGHTSGFVAAVSSAILQAFAAGTFIYVIFLEVLPPEISNTERRLLRFFFLMLGFGIILALEFGLKMDSMEVK